MNLRSYMYLIKQLVSRDVAGRYKGSLLGGVWAVASPLIMLAVYTFVFSMVFQVRWGVGDEANKTGFALNLFVGILLHGLLAETLSRTPTILMQQASFVKKIVFPLWLLPVAVVISALVYALIGFMVLFAVFVFLQGMLPLAVLALPLVLLPLFVFSLGAGWFLAALGVYVRDVAQIMPLFVTVLMFMAPIFYPISAIPEQYQGWLMINPLTYAVEMGRALLFTGQLPEPVPYLGYLALSVLCAGLGLAFFLKVRKGFADVL
ncbi:MAG: ABC transporter permease [Pseudomonas sp.]|nr:ABC transporter permease [Pseudomonas sp.]